MQGKVGSGFEVIVKTPRNEDNLNRPERLLVSYLKAHTQNQ